MSELSESTDLVGQPIDGRSLALKVENLSCSYSGVQAVKEFSLAIEQGAFLGLIGPNGAGKSTLIDCISGRNTSYKGRVFAGEREISRRPINYIADLGIIRTFQIARPFAKLTVLSNLMFGPRGQRGESLFVALIGGWKRQEVGYLDQAWKSLGLFGLGHVADNYGAQLSGGQERLVELSRAVMAGPRVLLLDEPFAGVSPSNRARLANHLRRLWNGGEITIVMVEHRLEWVERLCSRVVVMAEGSVLADGSMLDIRANQRVLEAYLGTP